MKKLLLLLPLLVALVSTARLSETDTPTTGGVVRKPIKSSNYWPHSYYPARKSGSLSRRPNGMYRSNIPMRNQYYSRYNQKMKSLLSQPVAAPVRPSMPPLSPIQVPPSLEQKLQPPVIAKLVSHQSLEQKKPELSLRSSIDQKSPAQISPVPISSVSKSPIQMSPA